MNSRLPGAALISSLTCLAAFGCSDVPIDPIGVAGSTSSTAGVGSGTSGATGTAGSGTGGSSATAGSAGTGTGGASSTAGATSTGGTTGTAGTAGSGSVAGSAGSAGAAGTGGSGGGGINVPRGNSMGCNKGIPAGDNPDNFTKHDVAVTGVDPKFITDHPPSPGNNGGYTYTNRNYFVKLPANYDPSKPYALTFGGGGCGNTSGDSGKGGGQQAGGIDSIKVGLSYVYSGGACFEDGYANTPEVPYFDAVLADISAKYCVNLEKVFVGGYSSGAWESVTLGLARAGKIRGIATGAGGLRKNRPMPSGIPMAAILLTGQGDTTNPITGETGSALARDEILKTNKCEGTATMPFPGGDSCVQYTGCPAAFPVVWCTPGGGHTGGSDNHWKAVGAFWAGLPAVP